MRNRFTGSAIGLLAALAFSCVAMAQTTQPSQPKRGDDTLSLSNKYEKLSKDSNGGGPAPVRDLTGVYAGPTSVGNGGIITDVPPLTPLGQTRFNANKANDGDNSVAGRKDPLDTCDPVGIPRNLIFETRGVAFATMPGKVLELFQYQRVWREIWTDGRELPKNVGAKDGPDPRYYGYSVGHWESDNTFAVETVGVDPRTWVDGLGHPHTVNLHLGERYTRPNHNTLDLVVTIDDPAYYTKPFTVANHFRWIPEQTFEEQLCIPSQGLEYLRLIGNPAGNAGGVAGSR
jgi:hypothetical protein